MDIDTRPPNDGPGRAPGTRVPARNQGKSGRKPRSSTPNPDRQIQPRLREPGAISQQPRTLGPDTAPASLRPEQPRGARNLHPAPTPQDPTAIPEGPVPKRRQNRRYRGVLMPRQPRRHTIAQENTAQEHEHKVVEILVCPGGFPAPQGRLGLRLRSPAARGPGGETRRRLVSMETDTIHEPHRAHRPNHPGRVPLRLRQPGGPGRPDGRRPGGGAALLPGRPAPSSRWRGL